MKSREISHPGSALAVVDEESIVATPKARGEQLPSSTGTEAVLYSVPIDPATGAPLQDRTLEFSVPLFGRAPLEEAN